MDSVNLQDLFQALEELNKKHLDEVKQLLQKFFESAKVDDEVTAVTRATDELFSDVWRNSVFDEAELAPAAQVPNLLKLLKQNNGKIKLENYSLYLSKNKKWVKRYRVKK